MSSKQPFKQPQPIAEPAQAEHQAEPVEDVVVAASINEEQCAPPSLMEDGPTEDLAAKDSIKDEKQPTEDETDGREADKEVVQEIAADEGKEMEEREYKAGNEEKSKNEGEGRKEEEETREDEEVASEDIQSSVAEEPESGKLTCLYPYLT